MSDLRPPQSDPRNLRSRAGIASLLAAIGFAVLAVRLYHLQVVRGDELSKKSRENYIKEIIEPADRGLILDSRGRLVADNRPSFDVYLTPKFVRTPEAVLARLQPILRLDDTEQASVLKAVKNAHGLDRFRPYLVKLDISRDQLDVVESEMAALDGIDILPSSHRNYRFGPQLAHVVGYLSQVSQSEFESNREKYRRGDFIGRRGIERSMESYLRGIDGRKRIAVDAKGQELDRETARQLIPSAERRVPSIPGHNVVLSVDLALQHIADRALQLGGRAGAVVVVDVKTGFIRALVSQPSYDPNRMTGRISRRDLQTIAGDPLQPLFQRAVQQHYHPGSTFKVVTALAALQKGLVSPDNSTFCGGGYSLGPRRWRCWNDDGHGSGIDLHRSLVASCDTYYYWLADRLGLDPIADMARRLGFAAPTGIEVTPEAAGVIPTVAFHTKKDRGYSKGYALNAAIGQGAVNVTPLQLAMAYAALGNGGTLYKPHLVERIEGFDGRIAVQTQPEVVRSLGLSAAHQRAVLSALEGVVNEPGGTAYSKRLSGIRVAGKTGTAQVVVIGEKRLAKEDMPWEHRDHAWFAGLAPADAPEIAVVVLNEHGGHGGSAAAPVAMAVIQGYFDLKRRDTPLSDEDVALLEPAPQFAVGAPRPLDPAVVATVPAVPGPRIRLPPPPVLPPGPPRVDPPTAAPLHPPATPETDSIDEPVSSAAEVADPSLLGPRSARHAASDDTPTPDVEAQPSPEE